MTNERISTWSDCVIIFEEFLKYKREYHSGTLTRKELKKHLISKIELPISLLNSYTDRLLWYFIENGKIERVGRGKYKLIPYRYERQCFN